MTRKPAPFATEATAPRMGPVRVAFLLYRLQARRLRALSF